MEKSYDELGKELIISTWIEMLYGQNPEETIEYERDKKFLEENFETIREISIQVCMNPNHEEYVEVDDSDKKLDYRKKILKKAMEFTKLDRIMSILRPKSKEDLLRARKGTPYYSLIFYNTRKDHIVENFYDIEDSYEQFQDPNSTEYMEASDQDRMQKALDNSYIEKFLSALYPEYSSLTTREKEDDQYHEDKKFISKNLEDIIALYQELSNSKHYYEMPTSELSDIEKIRLAVREIKMASFFKALSNDSSKKVYAMLEEVHNRSYTNQFIVANFDNIESYYSALSNSDKAQEMSEQERAKEAVKHSKLDILLKVPQISEEEKEFISEHPEEIFEYFYKYSNLKDSTKQLARIKRAIRYVREDMDYEDIEP